MSLGAAIAALRGAGIEATPLEVAEAIWLAQHLPTPAVAEAPAVAPPEQPAPAPEEVPERAAPVPQPPESVPLAAPADEPTAAAVAGQLVRAPDVPGLSDPRAIQRALRPLRRRVRSRRHHTVDEAATAAFIAGTGVWSPVLRPAPERWFDIVLAVDTSPSMDLWHNLSADLGALLSRSGAFRDVRTCRLTPHPDGCTITVGRDTTPRSARELIDGTGRRMFLVLTDGAAQAWHDGSAAATLSDWGRTGPVAVVQPLPEEMWTRTGLAGLPARLRSVAAGAPNSQLRVAYRRRRRARGVPVPVLGLEPVALHSWAGLVTSAASGVALAVTPAGSGRTTSPSVATVESADSPEVTFGRFRAGASPEAYQLAVCLSAVPLTLPVMRLVQHAAVPGANLSTLAEVMLGGLISRTGDDSYEFLDGIRDLLLGELRRSEAATVLSAVSGYVAEHAGSTGRSFPAVAGGADGSDTAAADPFGWVPPAVAARLGLRTTPATTVDRRPDLPTLMEFAFRTTEVGDRNRYVQQLAPASRFALLLAEAFHEIGLPWRPVSRQGRADRTLLALPAEPGVRSYLGRLVRSLEQAVKRHNRLSGEFGSITLRLAVHCAPTVREGQAPAGDAAATLHRLLDDFSFGAAPDAHVGMIVSSAVYERVLGSGGLDYFTPVQSLRGEPEAAWIHLPTHTGELGVGRPRSSPYLEAVRTLAPQPLENREPELAELSAFCFGAEPYQQWEGLNNAGMTALLSTFVLNPPAAVDVVSAFPLGPGGLTSADFVTGIAAQVASLTGAATPEQQPGPVLAHAAAWCRERGRRLVLVVDGLDETQRSTGLPSVAAMLPTTDLDVVRVVVSRRPGSALAPDVPADHPLRSSSVRRLTPHGTPYSTIVGVELAEAGPAEPAFLADTVRRAYELADLDRHLAPAVETGDGILMVVSPQVHVQRVLGPFVSALRRIVEEYNHSRTESEHLALRVAVHAGVLDQSGTAAQGRAMAEVVQFLDAPSLRRIRGELGLIVSRYIYDRFVRPEPQFTGFARTVVAGPGTEVEAWLWLPQARSAPVPPETTSYRDTVRSLAPAALPGRDQDLSELQAFCSGSQPYLWWQSGIRSALTDLLSWFALRPPRGVDVVSYFIGNRDRRTEATRFIDAVAGQLRELGLAPPAAAADTIETKRRLIAAALARPQRSRRLVLVVDGLDRASQPPTVAALLPVSVGTGVHVIVSSRPDYVLPRDLPADHPLRHCRVRPLRPPASAEMPPKPARAAKVMRTGPAGEPTMAELVETLPRSQRAVMRLVLAGASAEEISDELGRSRASVMRDMHRARQRLRELRAAPGRIG